MGKNKDGNELQYALDRCMQNGDGLGRADMS